MFFGVAAVLISIPPENGLLAFVSLNFLELVSPLREILPEPPTSPERIRSVPVAKDISTIGVPAKVTSLDIVIGWPLEELNKVVAFFNTKVSSPKELDV